MKLKRKLKSAGGETLVEVLVAMVVMMVTSVAFATMVSAATHINARSIEDDAAVYAALNAAETGDAESILDSGRVEVSVDGGSPVEFTVTYYGADGVLAAYRTGGGA